MTNPTFIQKPNRNRPEPLWHQTEQAIRAFIKDAGLQDGEQLPNETRLTEMFGVSRITLRHAIRRLEEAGLVRREHGRGTFVRRSTIVAGIRGLTSFTEEMRELGETAGTRHTRIETIAAAEEVAEALQIDPGSPVVRIRRLRLGNGNPIGVQTAFLPADRVPGFPTGMEELPSLYRLLEERYGLVPSEAEELYRVGTVSAEDAPLLEVAEGTPAFIVRRTTFDRAGPFEHVRSTMRADRYEIRSKLVY